MKPFANGSKEVVREVSGLVAQPSLARKSPAVQVLANEGPGPAEHAANGYAVSFTVGVCVALTGRVATTAAVAGEAAVVAGAERV
jgi:hypothetical protein